MEFDVRIKITQVKNVPHSCKIVKDFSQIPGLFNFRCCNIVETLGKGREFHVIKVLRNKKFGPPKDLWKNLLVLSWVLPLEPLRDSSPAPNPSRGDMGPTEAGRGAARGSAEA